MMYGYGFGGWWMMLMPLLWIALIALGVWAVVRSLPQSGPHRETPLEVLDRRYAHGEIDDTAYATARARLTDRSRPPVG
ncbi:MAG: SHOCT domain-containing protein [Hamadaea sp.]|nr:SHOCT domain-containing protein [Hamadaea sp.]NUR46838.1 SHOCT domain-containing protein [Hamadaea sp.]NUT06957.1 SHOCT domain-containing protein [Hamadaea sp.]